MEKFKKIKKSKIKVMEFTPEMEKRKKTYLVDVDERTSILINAYPNGNKLIVNKETFDTLKKEKAFEDE